MKDSYGRFAAMIGTSTAIMFALMYLHTYTWGHATFSETRAFMTLIMGSTMAVVMLLFMRSMYTKKAVNIGIFIASALLFLASLWLVRSQVTVSDSSWMRGMIPHHSIAILTSERVDFQDERVRQLAAAIVQAQRREIKEMNWLLDDIRDNGYASTAAEADSRPIPDFSVEGR